jgi:hypothetical protein
MNRRKALIYIDLFNMKQAFGTDPYAYAVLGTGANNAYGSYINLRGQVLWKVKVT